MGVFGLMCYQMRKIGWFDSVVFCSVT